MMAGMIQSLLSWFRKSQAPPPNSGDDALAAAAELVLSLLLPQVLLLEHKPGLVPTDGPTADKQSRAYMLGLCDCIYRTAINTFGSDFREADLIQMVFGAVYGNEKGKLLADMSVDEFQDPQKDDTILSGYNRAVSDLNRWKNAKASGAPDELPVGFWSFNHGMSFEEIVEWGVSS